MSSEPFLDTAAQIAREIAHTAVWHEGRCNWMGTLGGDDARPSARRVGAALGPDLYNGTAGVALFLAEAAVRLDDDAARVTALGALRHALDHAPRIAPAVRDGLYAGRAGLAYAAARAAHRLGAEEPLERARALLAAHRTPAGEAWDLVAGSAGAAVALLAFGDPALTDAATGHGEKLIDTATRPRKRPAASTMHNLCGYSHGAAGVGHALLELYAATSDDRYRAAAERAFGYEQSWFDRVGTWPDLRGVARATGYEAPAPPASSWCHGAPGIALSRLRAQRILGEPREDAATATALTKNIASGLLQREPDDFSLCHGAAGIADVLLHAASDDADARDLGLLGIEIHAARGFPTGIPAGPTPGLFLGLAGIGLLYLRLADPTLASPLIVHLDSAGTASIESVVDPKAR